MHRIKNGLVCGLIFVQALCCAAFSPADDSIPLAPKLEQKSQRSLTLAELFKLESDGTLSVIPGSLEEFPQPAKTRILGELERLNQSILDGREKPFASDDQRLSATSTATPKKKWAYLCVEGNNFDSVDSLTRKFNELGVQGWEFVGTAWSGPYDEPVNCFKK